MGTNQQHSSRTFLRSEAGVLWVLWLTYGSFYFCRTNISAAIPGIEAELGFSKAQIGLILGGLKLAYGIGQLVNGQLAEKFSARKLLTIGMLGSAILNVVFGFGAAVYFLLFIWACNGYFQALGWTPCMRVAANWFSVEKRGRAIGIIGTGYQTTAALTFVISGYSAQLLGWRGAFFVPAILFALCCIHMLIFLKESPPQACDPGSEQEPAPRPRKTGSIGGNILLTLTNPWLWFLAVSLGLLNACRYGFLDWGLAHLIETQGGTIGKSALKYAVLPLGGIAGALLSGWVTDRRFGGRAAPATVILLLALGILTLIYSKVVVEGTSVVLPMVLLASIGFCIYGPQVLLVGTAPMDFARGGAAAAAVGFVNFMGYMGAFSGDYVTGRVVDAHGWETGLKFWAGCAFAAAIISAFLWNRRGGEKELKNQ
ncbi:MAG: MFS transporter [Verrucomicrobia bacterium]|nr:MFS transporter [Verrucomicrobiota bacterium]